jgi:hypothetical protein
MTREQIEARVLARIARGAEAAPDDVEFEALALALFRCQYEGGDAYRRLCEASGRSPDKVSTWREIPAVPAGAFKEARLVCFPIDRTLRVFRTSGTSTARRGELHLDTLELYDASLLATFGAYICPDVERIRFLVLAPPASDAPDSSLSYMYDVAARRLGTPLSRFYLGSEGWDPEALLVDLIDLEEPVALVGTAFAFVHLLDFLAARGLELSLPEGTRVMETGGFKGRSRELSREQLHGAIAQRLGVPGWRIINQYGMCELASQFYEPSLRLRAPSRIKRVPPWVRTRVVDPATGREVAPGQVGILVHYDLANTGSVLAVQTSDAGRAVEGGFEVLGRLSGAEARGCSLAADLLLGGA